MNAISIYIGLFTGLLISGMGVYLYVRPIESNFPAWVQQGLPVFMIVYGAVRFGFSLYKIFQKNRGSDLQSIGVLLLAMLFLTECSSEPEPNLRLRFDYAGDCSTCPLSRMDSILKLYFPRGVIAVRLDSAQQQVILDLDTNHARMDTVRQVLLAYGYEIDEDVAVDPILSACCVTFLGAGGSSSADPLAGPSASDIQEDMSMLERELEQELGVAAEAPQLNLDAELNLDEDLGLDELDLEGGAGGEDLGLGMDELDMEMDLDMDFDLEEPKPNKPKKPSQSPQKKP